MNYEELVKALRCANRYKNFTKDCDSQNPNEPCRYCRHWLCEDDRIFEDAADAIEALQAEVQFYKALADEWQQSAENKERLLGLYRAEQAKHFYSAIDDNGRIIANPCACMNIPVFSDCSESPNS